jgi:hypothetical protein
MFYTSSTNTSTYLETTDVKSVQTCFTKNSLSSALNLNLGSVNNGQTRLYSIGTSLNVNSLEENGKINYYCNNMKAVNWDGVNLTCSM